VKKPIQRKTKLISIVIPFYNEEENVNELYKQLKRVLSTEKKYHFEIIAVEHGSEDSTFQKLLNLNKKDKMVKIIQLSKNFGTADAGIAAGLNYATGQAVIITMADLQEPPEVIIKFIRKWEEGYEIVYGVINKRADFSYLRRVCSVIYYKILNKLTDNIFPKNVSDFRLIDKKVCETINQMEERNKFLRGMIIWTGFKQIGVPFNRLPRHSGESKANFSTALKVAANGIFSFSYLPLKLVTILGFIVSLLSLAMIVVQLILFIHFGRVAPGQTTIVLLISFFFGILFLILGIISEYLARIYDEVKQRPAFIVKKTIGIKE